MKLDRMKIQQTLNEAGVPEEQATAHAEVFGEMQEELATKADLDENRLAQKADLEAVRLAQKADLEAAMSAQKADMEAAMKAAMSVQKADLESAMLAQKSDLEEKMSRMEVRLIKWNVATIFAAAGMMLAFLRLFPG